MKNIRPKEIWFVRFPLEEDETQKLNRPVLVIDNEDDEYLVVKITKHKPRGNDNLDFELEEWQAANLDFPSTARISKLRLLPKSDFIKKIGTIHSDDWQSINKKIEEM